MVIGAAAGLVVADQYGSAHATPIGLGLLVIIAVIVGVLILSKRGG
jgi:hypothetical protein